MTPNDVIYILFLNRKKLAQLDSLSNTSGCHGHSTGPYIYTVDPSRTMLLLDSKNKLFYAELELALTTKRRTKDYGGQHEEFRKIWRSKRDTVE